jgi:hypothetical protein
LFKGPRRPKCRDERQHTEDGDLVEDSVTENIGVDIRRLDTGAGLESERRIVSVTHLMFRGRLFMPLDHDRFRRLGRRRGVTLQHANSDGDSDQRFQMSGFRLSGIHSRALRQDLASATGT